MQTCQLFSVCCQVKNAVSTDPVFSFGLHLDRFTKQLKVKHVKTRLKLLIICTLHMSIFHYISNYSDYPRTFYTFSLKKTLTHS